MSTATVNSSLWQKLQASSSLLTTDKNIRYQQNLTQRKIAILVLGNQQWPVLRFCVDRVVDAVNAAKPGSYAEVDIPFQRKGWKGVTT